MLKGLFLGLRLILLVLGGHKQVALENVALRHQIAEAAEGDLGAELQGGTGETAANPSYP